MINIAVFASGKGSNAKALFSKARDLENLKISLLVTDQKDAGVIQWATENGLQVAIIEKRNHSKKEHEDLILKMLTEHQIDWILLAGYMRLLSSQFIDKFHDQKLERSRIINIHPSLLPEFKGLEAYERAYESSQDYSGISVHFVDAGMDTGPIITQERFDKSPADTLDEFKSRGLALEHKLYPQVLEKLNQYIAKNDIRTLYAF